MINVTDIKIGTNITYLYFVNNKVAIGVVMENKMYIIGHKNPDTDSVCSAIAYAELKKELGYMCIPARNGKINKETEFVLKYFDVNVPTCMETVCTQVSDLDMDIINPILPDISLKTAWNLMVTGNIKVLPVVDDNKILLGMITLSDITNNFMNALENNILSASNTPLDSIVETLNAQLLYGTGNDFENTGKVVISSMMAEDMEPYISQGDIVFVGNRNDSQIKAINLGAGCIIGTCGSYIEKEVIELASQKKCIIMRTNYDTFTAARLINQSIPVGFIMTKNDLVCFKMNDFTDTIKEKMINTRYRSYPVIDNDNKYRGFISRYHLISQNRKKVILIDHNEKMQTIDGIEQAEIMEVIDHHRLGDIQTSNPIFFRNEPVGSTATLIADMYFNHGLEPTKRIAGILCAAILSDTLKFKSPTSTCIDEQMAKKLSQVAEVDIDEFALELFHSTSYIKNMSGEDIVNYDFKKYDIGKFKVGIGQINVSDIESFMNKQEDIISYMDKLIKNEHYNLILLMGTNIIDIGSYLLFTGDASCIMEKAFNVKADQKLGYFKDVISRKKQIIPEIAKAAAILQNEGIENVHK